MQERIIGAALGGVRVVLVVVALAVALVPIGRSAVTGFCPPATGLEDATAVGAPSAPRATGAGPAATTVALVLAAPDTVLATVVEPDATASEGVPAPTTTDGAPTDGGSPSGNGTDGATPSEGDATPDDGTGATDGTGDGGEDTSACPDGVDRCLPPLVSAVVSFGSGPCGGEALAMLRGSMLPAFGIATVLLGGAWALRPRHGHGVLSRW